MLLPRGRDRRKLNTIYFLQKAVSYIVLFPNSGGAADAHADGPQRGAAGKGAAARAAGAAGAQDDSGAGRQ